METDYIIAVNLRDLPVYLIYLAWKRQPCLKGDDRGRVSHVRNSHRRLYPFRVHVWVYMSNLKYTQYTWVEGDALQNKGNHWFDEAFLWTSWYLRNDKDVVY